MWNETSWIRRKPANLSAVQALASIGQVRLIRTFDDLFRQLEQPIAQILLTRNDIMDFTQYKNAQNTLNELMDMGIIPIVNETIHYQFLKSSLVITIVCRPSQPGSFMPIICFS